MPTIYDPTTGDMIELPTRWYDADTIRDEFVPAGVYTDWQSDVVREYVFRLRTNDPRPTHREIAATTGMQHWLHSYRAQDCEARRRQRDVARGTAEHIGIADNRSWSTRRRGPGMTDPDGRRNQGLVVRRFGMELEFNRADGYNASDMQEAIVYRCNGEGIPSQIESYNHTTRPHWKMTTDATVTGGEFVSPPMAGDTASLDQCRRVMEIVKEEGGVTGSNVGLHIHIDCMDFTTADQRVNLVNVLERVQSPMSQFVPRNRIDRSRSHGGGLLTAENFNTLRSCITTIEPGADGRGYRREGYVPRDSFANIEGPLLKYGTIEFRGLGNTLHLGKVRVWIRVCQAVVEAARQGLEFSENMTPTMFADELVGFGLLGRRAADKFVGECNRRQHRNTNI